MDKETPIYEIYAFRDPITTDNWGRPKIGHYVSMGFYYELETAKQAVKENWTDINEKGCYNAAMVVKKGPGLYPIVDYCGYYIFNKKTETYDNQEIPEEVKGINLG